MRRPRASEAVAAVADHFGVPSASVVGSSHHAHLAGPHRVACLILHGDMGYSFTSTAEVLDVHCRTVLRRLRAATREDVEDAWAVLAVLDAQIREPVSA